MELTQILQKALEIGGSDIFLIPGSAATAKVKGHLVQLTEEKLLPADTADMIREASAPYFVKKQGDYTLEDYYAIPDDIRVELIDGVIYDMSAPTSVHQLLTGFLFTQFMNHVMKEKGSCLPIVSPIDVQLDCDDRTMLQPDVVIVCDRKKVVHRCVYGAPDFVLEILSPSSRKKDSIIKLNKYMNAGVRE